MFFVSVYQTTGFKSLLLLTVTICRQEILLKRVSEMQARVLVRVAAKSPGLEIGVLCLANLTNCVNSMTLSDVGLFELIDSGVDDAAASNAKKNFYLRMF